MPELPGIAPPACALLPRGEPSAPAAHERGDAAGAAAPGVDFHDILLRELGLPLALVSAAGLIEFPAEKPRADGPLGDVQAAIQPGAAVPIGLPIAPAAIGPDAGVLAQGAPRDAAIPELQGKRTPALPMTPLDGRMFESDSPAFPAAANFAAHGRLPPPPELPLGARAEHVIERSESPQARALAPVLAHGTAPSQPHSIVAPPPGISAPFGTPRWNTGLGEQMVWMSTQQNQVAELRLNPPDLGPLQITLTVNNDQASAQFVSHHAAVREAIEAALPRLKEMLADSGITLGDATVSADSFTGRSGAGGTRQDGAASRGDDQGNAAGPPQRGSLLWWHRGSVDVFA